MKTLCCFMSTHNLKLNHLMQITRTDLLLIFIEINIACLPNTAQTIH